MEWYQLLSDGYGRITGIVERALRDIDPDDLDRQPQPDCNTVGWLIWHLTRVQDHQVADLIGEEQLWTGDGWHEKLGRPADPADIGWGHTADQVRAFRSPQAAVLLDYHRAVSERSRSFFTTLSPADLDRELDEPQYQPLPTVGVRLVSVLSDNLQHAGQAAFVRGLLRAAGA